MKCPKCGIEARPGVSYCLCGYRLVAAPPRTTRPARTTSPRSPGPPQQRDSREPVDLATLTAVDAPSVRGLAQPRPNSDPDGGSDGRPEALAVNSGAAVDLSKLLDSIVGSSTAPTADAEDVAGRPARSLRRFLARLIDTLVFSAPTLQLLLWLVATKAPEQLPAYLEILGTLGFAAIFYAIVVMPPTSLALALTGTTPGKWFFGIRVTDANGAKLSIVAAYRRETLVGIVGMGGGLPILSLLALLLARRQYTATGRTLWDAWLGCRVVHV
jgi:uncharacterized RDD family membrane protein YckC